MYPRVDKDTINIIYHVVWRIFEDKIATKANFVRKCIVMASNICSMCWKGGGNNDSFFCTCRM